MADGGQREQLQMLWPQSRLGSPPEVTVPEGYGLRTFVAEDAPRYLELMAAAGFEGWDAEVLATRLSRVLPGGFFLAVHGETGESAATAMVTHNPSDMHPFGGELGWVAAHPAHRGRGLGTTVCAAVTRRFLEMGYRRIYLKTDDWRLPAIKVYLRLGYEPFLFARDSAERWREVCKKLSRPFTPDDWPKSDGAGSAARQDRED